MLIFYFVSYLILFFLYFAIKFVSIYITSICTYSNEIEMAKFIIIFLVFFSIQGIYAQDALYEAPDLGPAVAYETVEVKPEFYGGYIAFVKYVASNFVLPEVESLSGAVKVSFVIGTNGKIDNIKVLKDLGEGTGEEAIRVLKSCPAWIPGEQEGKKVKVLVNMPINLKI